MNTELKRNINTIGKIGRIIASIMAVLMIIAAVALTAVTALTATQYKETVDITLNGSAGITSRGELLSNFKKVFDLKQDGDSAKLDLASSGVDVDLRVADSDNILENAKLTETADGYRVDVRDKTVSVSMQKITSCLALSLFEVICTAVVLFMLRSLMKSLEIFDTPFATDVIARMKRFGYSLIPFAAFRSASKSAWSSVLDAGSGSGINIGFSLDLTVILGIIVILMIVMIFAYGAQLQKESDETL